MGQKGNQPSTSREASANSSTRKRPKKQRRRWRWWWWWTSCMRRSNNNRVREDSHSHDYTCEPLYLSSYFSWVRQWFQRCCCSSNQAIIFSAFSEQQIWCAFFCGGLVLCNKKGFPYLPPYRLRAVNGERSGADNSEQCALGILRLMTCLVLAQ